MTQPLHKRPAHHLRASDLRAAAQLAAQATHAITRISEGVHQSVWRTLGAPSGATAARTRGLTGLVYQSVAGGDRADRARRGQRPDPAGTRAAAAGKRG